MSDIVDSLRYLDDVEQDDEDDVDDLDLDGDDVDHILDAPSEEVLQTRTVSSVVAGEDEETLGHVGLLDYDDVDPRVPVSDSQTLDGLSVVCRSSPGCYHLWDLRVHGYERVVRRLSTLRGSEEYLSDMMARGELALRVGPRVRDSGEVETRPPVPVHIAPGDVRLDRPVSAPHVEVLRDLSLARSPDEVSGTLDSLLSEDRAVGDLLVREVRRVPSPALRRVL